MSLIWRFLVYLVLMANLCSVNNKQYARYYEHIYPKQIVLRLTKVSSLNDQNSEVKQKISSSPLWNSLKANVKKDLKTERKCERSNIFPNYNGSSENQNADLIKQDDCPSRRLEAYVNKTYIQDVCYSHICQSNTQILFQRFESQYQNESFNQSCSYYEKISTIICDGMSYVPNLSGYGDDVRFIIMKNGSFLSLEESDATENLFTEYLSFINGILTRISPGFLQKTNVSELSIINNDLTSWSFSWFYNASSNKDSNITAIDLSNNLINYLSQSVPDSRETVLPKLKQLTMDGNCMRILPAYVFKPLRNSPVTCLSLRNCALRDFETGSSDKEESPLRFLEQLVYLDLSLNKFLNGSRLAALLKGLQNGNLETLILAENDYLLVPREAIAMVAHSLINLNLQWSSLSCLDSTSFPSLPNLSYLNMDSSRLSEIYDGTFQAMVSLEHLVISKNELYKMPNAIKLPHLKVLDIGGNPYSPEGDSCRFILDESSFRLMKSLEELNMADVILGKVTTNSFKNLESLKLLYLNKTQLTEIEPGSFRSLESLQYLVLAENSLTYITNGTFEGLHNLIYLDLSYNRLSLTSHTTVMRPIPITLQSPSYGIVKPFLGMENLKTLNLSYNVIKDLNPIFEDISKIEEIDFRRNILFVWSERLFRSNNLLTCISLKGNLIEAMTDAMVEDFKMDNMTTIDISDNQFKCSCDLNVYMTDIGIEKFKNFEEYECYYEDQSTEKVTVYIANSTSRCCECQENGSYLNSSSTVVIVVSVIVVLGVIIVAVSSIYLRLKKKSRKPLQTEEIEIFDYDVFICYAQAQKDWVFRILLPIMEESLSLKCCVHERDFQAGDFIQKNIEKSILQSRKVLMVFSEAFIQSEWCLLELKLAESICFQSETRKMIVLQIEAIRGDNQPKLIKNIINKRTCLLWLTDDIKVLQSKLEKTFL